MRKVSLLIAVCFVLAVMVVTMSAMGGGQGRGGGGGQRGPAIDISGPAPTGANGAADLQQIMQRLQAIGGGRGSLTAKVSGGDAAGAAADLTSMQSLFTAAQTAFTKEKVKGAADLAKAASEAAGDAAKTAKSGKVDAATTKAVTDACGGCHTTYREKDASGAFKIKAQ
jgi:hypothetical protein